jgi:hypothetical protein
MARRSTRALVAGILLASVGFAGLRAHGEDAPAAEAGRTLAAADLDSFLVEGGHPSKPFGTLRRVEVVKEGVTFYCDVAISPDGRYVWLTIPLAPLPASPVPRKQLVDLLAANGGEAGLHFLVAGDKIVLARAVDNRSLTPPGLSMEIRRFADALRTSAALWDVSRWPKGEGK